MTSRSFLLAAASVVLLLAGGCASRVTYTSDYPLSMTLFSFRHAPVHGRVPQGWFSVADDTLQPSMIAWLVASDYSAYIGVRELRLDQRAMQEVRDRGLQFLAGLSIAYRTSTDTSARQMGEPEELALGGRKFCAYECRVKGVPSRVVVFPAGGRYFECEATPARPGAPESGARLLFRIQQSVLASLVY